MGTIRNGANGGFSGKAGSIIGSNWNNISYIKGLPKLSRKPPSLKQLDQRARFAAVLGYIGPIKDVMMLGWKGQAANRATGFNMAVQQALADAVIGTYPNYLIDRSQVQVSKGTLQKYLGESIISMGDGKLELSWSPLVTKLTSFNEDELFVLLYNEQQDLFLPFPNAAKRPDGSVVLDIPSSFAGQTVHAYAFYVNPELGRLSTSVYLNPVQISNL